MLRTQFHQKGIEIETFMTNKDAIIKRNELSKTFDKKNIYIKQVKITIGE
jgi:hypothetical protein